MQVNLSRPLQEVKDESYTQLKEDLYIFLTVTSDFPEWKQANYNQLYTELKIKELGTTLSQEEQDTLDAVQEAIDWKNILLAERARVKALIDASTTTAEIKTSVDGFVYTPVPPLLTS